MAITVAFEFWDNSDAYAAADILQDYTSGTISALVAGIRGEGQAISLPSNLLKTGTSTGTQWIGHVRARYDQDDSYFVQVHTGAATGPFLKMTAGVLTAHRSDGALIGTASGTWTSGRSHSLSIAFALANTAAGSVKLWIDGSVVLNLSSVQTVPTAASVNAEGILLNGFGLFDDAGFRYGSGTWVDADVPLNRWVRTRRPSAAGTNQGFSTYGSPATHLAGVNETLGNGGTNGVEYPSNDGVNEGFLMGTLPANVGDIWGVQYAFQVAQTGVVAGMSVAMRTRDGGGPHSIAGSFALTPSYAYFSQFLKLNPGTAATWGSEYNTTELEAFVSASNGLNSCRFSQYVAQIIGLGIPDLELTPDPAVANATAAAPLVTLELKPDPAIALASPLVVTTGPEETIGPAIAVSSAPSVSVTFTTPPPPPPTRCDHPTQPAYLAQLQDLLPRGPAWTRDPEAVLTALLSAFAAEFSCVDDRARTLLRESDPRTTLELLPDWERAFGLPDPCAGPLATVEARRAAIVQKLASQGGASPAYIEATLASRGFPNSHVVEFAPFVAGSRAGDRLTSPQKAFRAGSGRAGDWLTNNERWLYTWAVESPDLTFSSFHAGSLAGEALRTWGNGVLECVVAEIQPAHTFVLFFYFRDLRPDPAVATLTVPAVTVT